MSKSLTLKLNKNKFPDLISKLEDLVKIDPSVKFKITSEKMLIYSMIRNESLVLAMKSYILKTSDYIENFKEDETYDFISIFANKLVKDFKLFNCNDDVKVKFTSKLMPDDDTTYHVRSALFSNNKLKITCVGGEQYKMMDINFTKMEKVLDDSNCEWKFKVNNEDFSYIKKLSANHSEDKVFSINVIDGEVVLKQPNKWEIKVDDIQKINGPISNDYKNSQLLSSPINGDTFL